MSSLTHISIVHIACRLISGRKIALLYDLVRGCPVDSVETADTLFAHKFNDTFRGYIPGFAHDCRYDCTSDSGQTVEIFINERTFIAHFRGTDAYFIGNMQRDIIYIYDQKGNAHFKYRLAFSSEEDKDMTKMSHDAAEKDLH